MDLVLFTCICDNGTRVIRYSNFDNLEQVFKFVDKYSKKYHVKICVSEIRLLQK